MTTPDQALLNARARAEQRRFYESQTLQDGKDTFAHGAGQSMSQAKDTVLSLFDTKADLLLIDGPEAITLAVGETIDLDVFLYRKFNNLPRLNRDKSATWTSSVPAKATVDMGLVTALVAGVTNISAVEGSFTSNTIVITVV